MQYLILGYDGNDSGALSRRLAAREAHIELGNKLRDEGKLLYGVAILNDAGKMIGSALVGDFENETALEEWLKIEPYVTGDVWRQIVRHPCKVGPSFAGLRNNA